MSKSSEKRRRWKGLTVALQKGKVIQMDASSLVIPTKTMEELAKEISLLNDDAHVIIITTVRTKKVMTDAIREGEDAKNLSIASYYLPRMTTLDLTNLLIASLLGLVRFVESVIPRKHAQGAREFIEHIPVLAKDVVCKYLKYEWPKER